MRRSSNFTIISSVIVGCTSKVIALRMIRDVDADILLRHERSGLPCTSLHLRCTACPSGDEKIVIAPPAAVSFGTRIMMAAEPRATPTYGPWVFRGA
ncbi:hypothetical protein B0H16DRAFT_540513 [Mycena metata]|uniref:Uncharacterized protein n=1 Tax=Mycena metata TaxID=1033252 RepID=A0AAD7JCZ5_9AGAR|nr:hypothetical protein B0H16DRAFT_540513 [Mycena metata]